MRWKGSFFRQIRQQWAFRSIKDQQIYLDKLYEQYDNDELLETLPILKELLLDLQARQLVISVFGEHYPDRVPVIKWRKQRQKPTPKKAHQFGRSPKSFESRIRTTNIVQEAKKEKCLPISTTDEKEEKHENVPEHWPITDVDDKMHVNAALEMLSKDKEEKDLQWAIMISNHEGLVQAMENSADDSIVQDVLKISEMEENVNQARRRLGLKPIDAVPEESKQ